MAIKNEFTVATLTLAAAVANGGTTTLAYPAGTSQLSFTQGLNVPAGHYVVLNKNDRWAVATPGIAVAFGASLITITNNSGYSWAAGTVVDVFLDRADGTHRIPITVPIFALSAIAAADLVTGIRPGIAGTLEYMEFVTQSPVTTAAKLATLTPKIDGVAVTGGTLALTSAAATPMGKVIAAADITGANTLTKDSVITITGSAVTAFVEGNGFLLLYARPTVNTLV